MNPPENTTLQQAAPEDRSAAAHQKTVLKMLAGDHWQGGQGWVGPRLDGTDPRAGEFLLAVQKQYMPKNALGEITRRHVGAVIGRYPVIKLALRDATAKPTEAQQAEMKAGEGALTTWLDTTRALGKLQRFTTLLLLGRAHLSNYVPTGELRDGRIPPGDLITSIRRIRLRVPEPGVAEVIDDEDSGTRYALYRTKTQGGAEVVEVTTLTQDGKTVVRRLEPGAAPAPGQPPEPARDNSSDAVDMAGHLTITEATREQFLTPTLVSNNRMLNFAKTAILRNAELAAILERYGIGILPPGQWVADSTGKEVYQADTTWRPGGANATFFPPATFTDEKGGLRSSNSAQYGRFEPVNPAALIATKQDAYHDMLDEAAQSHIRMSGDATASGESRIQAMNDFKTSLYATATPIEHALTDHLEMTLAWAASLSGKPGRFRDYRVVVQCRITAAQPTTEERKQIVAERDAGLRTTENAMSEIGVEDTDEMLAGVQAEEEDKLKRGQAAAAALGAMLDPPKGGANEPNV